MTVLLEYILVTALLEYSLDHYFANSWLKKWSARHWGPALCENQGPQLHQSILHARRTLLNVIV